MKGRFIFLFLLLIMAYNVFGQGVEIGGQEISFLILIPLIIIIIVIILFAVLFLMDTRSYSRETEVRIKEEEKKETKNIEEEKKQVIWINYLDVIDTFIKRLDQKEPYAAFDYFIKIVRGFFRDRLNLRYEFTYDELLNELKKTDFNKTNLIKYLADLTYRDKKIDKKEIYAVAEEFREIIKIIDKKKLDEIDFAKINKNVRFAKTQNILNKIQNEENKIDYKLNKFLTDETKKIIRHKPKTQIIRNYDEFDREKVEQILFLIQNGKRALEENEIDKLREIYSDICYLFPFLSDNNKKIAYLEILEFYENINRKLFPELFVKKDRV